MDDNDMSEKFDGYHVPENKKAPPIYVKYGLIAVAVIIAVSVGLMIAFNSGSTVATIDGKKISADEFRYYFELQRRLMYSEAYNLDPTIAETTFWSTKISGEDPRLIAKEKAKYLMRDNNIQYAKAKAAKVSLTSDETKSIDDWINTNIIQRYGNGNKAQANKTLQQLYGYSVDVLRQAQIENYTTQKFKSQEVSSIPDADASVDKYYKSNLGWFMEDTSLRTGGEEAVWARHILFQFPENAAQSDKDAARKKAENVIAQLKAGADFATLARQLSEDPGSKDRGGDYLFGKSVTFSPEFMDAAFTLNPGQFTQTPVMTDVGYHVIKVEEKYAEDESVSLRCANDYFEYGKVFIKNKLYQQKLDGWIKTADFKLNRPVYDSIDINPGAEE